MQRGLQLKRLLDQQQNGATQDEIDWYFDRNVYDDAMSEMQVYPSNTWDTVYGAALYVATLRIQRRVDLCMTRVMDIVRLAFTREEQAKVMTWNFFDNPSWMAALVGSDVIRMMLSPQHQARLEQLVKFVDAGTDFPDNLLESEVDVCRTFDRPGFPDREEALRKHGALFRRLFQHFKARHQHRLISAASLEAARKLCPSMPSNPTIYTPDWIVELYPDPQVFGVTEHMASYAVMVREAVEERLGGGLVMWTVIEYAFFPFLKTAKLHDEEEEEKEEEAVHKRRRS